MRPRLFQTRDGGPWEDEPVDPWGLTPDPTEQWEAAVRTLTYLLTALSGGLLVLILWLLRRRS